MNKFTIKINVDTDVESEQVFDFVFGRKIKPISQYKLKSNIDLDPIIQMTITEVPDYTSSKKEVQSIFNRFSELEMDYIIYKNGEAFEIGRNNKGCIELLMSHG